MEVESIASLIREIAADSPVCLVRTLPEINDFTRQQNFKIVLQAKTKSYEISLDKTNHRRYLTILKTLERSLFSDGRTAITWDIKRLVTYVLFHFKYRLSFKCNVIDLKYGEFFLGVPNPPPSNFTEATARVRHLIKNSDFLRINREMFLPLSLEVLPSIEVKGIGRSDLERAVYVAYELVGHKNGRLIAATPSPLFVNVHSMTDGTRRNLIAKPKHVFIELDYDHMEVNVLQWLSGDEKLLELLKSGQDVYSSIYNIVFDKPCESEGCRNLIKRIFLPYMFGLQAGTLADEMAFSYEDAKTILDKIERGFPTACDWVRQREKETRETQIAKDHFGRVRDFSFESSHKSRNFFIQSPAAVVCILKMIELYRELDKQLLFNIHDAYVLSCELAQMKNVIRQARQVLDSTSDMYPGLVLRTSCSVGVNLASMKRYPI